MIFHYITVCKQMTAMKWKYLLEKIELLVSDKNNWNDKTM